MGTSKGMMVWVLWGLGGVLAASSTACDDEGAGSTAVTKDAGSGETADDADPDGKGTNDDSASDDVDDDRPPRDDDSRSDDDVGDDSDSVEDDDGANDDDARSDDDVGDDSDSVEDDDGANDDDVTADDDGDDDAMANDDDRAADDDVLADDDRAADDDVLADDDRANDDDGTASDDDTPSDDDVTDDDHSDDDGEPEGPRLQRRYLVAQGGAEQFVGYWDRVAGQLCSFSEWEASSGVFSCEQRRVVSVVYLDGECSEPAAVWNAGWCLEEGHVVRTSSGAVTLGELVEPSAVYQVNGSSCTATTVSASSRYARAEPAPAGPFVGGEREVDTLEDGLGLAYVAAEGDRFFVDALLADAPCYVYPTAGTPGDAHCFPADTAWSDTTYYADEGCTGARLAVFSDGDFASGTPSYTLHRGDTTACEGPAPCELGAEVAVSSVWYSEQGSCVERPLQYEAAYALSEPVSLDTFPRLEQVELGDGRLRYQARVASNGVAVGDVRWFDTDYDATCVPSLTSDGVRRCVPVGAASPSSRFFTDPGCTEPLLERLLYECTAEAPPPFVVSRASSGQACSEQVATIEAALPFTNPVYELVAVDTCEPAGDTSEYEFFTRGDTVDPSTFAEMSYVER